MNSGWGAGAKTLRIATLSLVYLAAEYCAPVWCRSAHTRLIDSVLNDALRIVTGCLCPTPTDHLPMLSGIKPAELRRMGATLSLTHRGSLDHDHILYGLLSGSSDTRHDHILHGFFQWVLRYSPSETNILTPVCASYEESFEQPCQIWHPRF